MTAPRETSGSKFLSLPTVLAGLLTMGIGSSVGMMFNINSRLSHIEGAIQENKSERVQQIEDLRSRITKLEDRFYGGGRQ